MNTFESLGIRLGELKEAVSSANSRDFLERVFSEPLTTYSSRLAALGFVGRERVLDAGCGFGQWSVAMALQNKFVDAIDVDSQRGMTPIFRSSVDGSPDRQRGWRKDEHHDDSSKEVP